MLKDLKFTGQKTDNKQHSKHPEFRMETTFTTLYRIGLNGLNNKKYFAWLELRV